MKWNVIVKNLSTGTIGPYNIFDCADFRIAVEKIISQKYDKTRFLEELDREADYCFRAQIEWETFSQPGRLILAQRKLTELSLSFT